MPRLSLVGLTGCVAAFLAAACDSLVDQSLGTVRVILSASGGDFDLDGYELVVDGAGRQHVDINGIIVVSGVPAGRREIRLDGVAANCTVGGVHPRPVAVQGGATVDVSFAVACLATGVQVVAVTTGIDLDPDGYTVAVSGVATQSLPVNDSLAVTRMAPGDYVVILSALSPNCSVGGQNPRSVSVAPHAVVRVAFAVTCVATTGVVEVTTATTGVELDAGYTVHLDGGTIMPVPANGRLPIAGVGPGNHTVTLADISSNCAVSGENPRIVSVTTGGTKRDTARTTFELSCVATTGTLEVAVQTSGTELDPDGYHAVVDPYCDYYGCSALRDEPLGVNGTVVMTSVPVGQHSISLTEVARNCTVGGQNPRTATVPSAGVVRVEFAVSCVQTGSVQVTVATSGVDLDADGYTAIVNGPVNTSAGLAASGTVTIAMLIPGSYTVSIAGLAVNCDIGGQHPRTITVSGGATTAVAFDIACAVAPQLAFTMTTNGNTDVYLIKSNGAGVTRLTVEAAPDYDAAWSPDGARIAFVSERHGNPEIYVMNADGSNVVRLTNDLGVDHDPAWSPDGAQIAFQSRRAGGDSEIYVMNADGSNVVRLTFAVGGDHDPAWSPDGSRIAFASTREGDAEIYVMLADGSGVTRLTTNDSDDHWPDWSPDGTKIVFSHFNGCQYGYYSYYCDYDIHVVNSDGSGLTPLATGRSDTDPAWSPDGRWIAFATEYCDYYYGCYDQALALVRTDGSRFTPVAHSYAGAPAWRP